MTDNMDSSVVIPAAALGVLFHVLVSCRIEVERYVRLMIAVASAALPASVYLLHQGPGGRPVPEALSLVLWTAGAFAAGHSASLLAYRLFLHPLRRFPGPLGARITKLYSSRQAWDNFYYKEVRAMHERYGDFIRTGMSVLVSASLDVVPPCLCPIQTLGYRRKRDLEKEHWLTDGALKTEQALASCASCANRPLTPSTVRARAASSRAGTTRCRRTTRRGACT